MEHDYNKFLASFSELPTATAQRSIFSIGGRGYYENPLSDLLSFFLDPGEEHCLSTLVLDCLLKLVPGFKSSSACLVHPPVREYRSNNGGRIDILLEGPDWVLAVEAKINHAILNPIQDYEDTVKRICNASGKTPYLIFLLPSARLPSNRDGNDTKFCGWEWVSLEKLEKSIDKKISRDLPREADTRWTTLLKELLILVKEICNTGVNAMETDRFEFVKNNYENYRKAVEEFNLFESKLLDVLRSSAKESLGHEAARSSSVSWRSHGRAYCIYPEAGSDVNLTFLVTPSGKVELKLYTDAAFRKGFQSPNFEPPFKLRPGGEEEEKIGDSSMLVHSSEYLSFSEALETFTNSLAYMAKRL